MLQAGSGPLNDVSDAYIANELVTSLFTVPYVLTAVSFILQAVTY